LLPEALRGLVERPSAAAVLVDFDGSVASIVDDPAAAAVLPDARAALGALAERIALVGVVSGRPVEFLARALALPALTLVGQYGLERSVDGQVVVDPQARPYLPAVAAAAAEAAEELPGLLIERKAGVAVTIHWRTTPEREEEAIAVAERIAARHGLALSPTRMARELRPPVPVDKGTAVESLLDGCRAACFAGDDHGDLHAFDALDRLRGRGALDTAVKIAVRSAEVPRELLDRADLGVDGPPGLVGVLEALVSELDGPR
jgi:trehalose 6-phosphate phosphatase